METMELGVSIIVDGDECEWECVVEYTYCRASRGARDSLGGIANAGPPLEPDEPAYAEIQSVIAHRLHYNRETKRHERDYGPFDLWPLLSEEQGEHIQEQAAREYEERRSGGEPRERE